MPEAPPSASARRLHRTDAAAAAVAALLATAFFAHAGFFNDDALITLRYSRHLAEGEGLVYNPGERALGTTTPLWALLMAGAGAIGLPYEATATAGGIAALALAAAFASALLRGRGASASHQLVGGLLVATSPVLLLWAGSGMESLAAAALVGGFLVLFERPPERRRPATMGAVGGLMVLTRPDLGLVLAAAAALEVARSRSVRPVVAAAPGFAAVVLPWVVGATLYFGSPLPNSGFAKRLQVEDWGTFAEHLGETLLPLGAVAAAALAGTVASLRSPALALPVAAFAALTAGLHLGGLPGCPWYMVVPVHLLTLLAGIGVAEVAPRIAAAPAARPLALAVAAAPFLAHATLPADVRAAKVRQSNVERCHGAVGTWLGERAPRGVSVGVDNIGYIGWRSGLRIVDMLGLVQPENAEGIRAGRRDHALRTHRPEMIAVWQGRSSTWKYLPDAAWFASEGYAPVFEAPLHPPAPRPAYVVFSRVPVE